MISCGVLFAPSICGVQVFVASNRSDAESADVALRQHVTEDGIRPNRFEVVVGTAKRLSNNCRAFRRVRLPDDPGKSREDTIVPQTKEEQGVRVKISGHYEGQKGSTITRIEMPVEELGRLVSVIMRAMDNGLGVKHGQLQLHLTRYSGNKTVSNGRLGIVRKGAGEKRKAQLVGK
jgi:hypothetical protein